MKKIILSLGLLGSLSLTAADLSGVQINRESCQEIKEAFFASQEKLKSTNNPDARRSIEMNISWLNKLLGHCMAKGFIIL